ncbi:MAG: hypothetical protein IT365_25190 [Candidatus Hydrogenedentes bacterium]|nr:hypothetical protein [Candidatus Hydrogenedentota bacterium]
MSEQPEDTGCLERVILALLGVITGGQFSFYCYLLAFFVLGNFLEAYEPSFPIERSDKSLIGEPIDALTYLIWLPALFLLLVVLPRSAFARLKWVTAGVFVSQFVASRAFAFLLQYFHNYHDSAYIVDTFAEIRREMTTLDRWIYSPLVALLERGWGYWAVALHSILLGTLWTLVIYGVYRVIKRLVLARRAAREAKASGLEAR